jgi:YbbR domain-containing protein
MTLKIREKIFANPGWKIAAILLALVLWFHVATEKTYEKIFQAKIETVGLPKNLQVETIEPKTTRVSVIGTGKQLLQLMLSGGVEAYLDLSLVTRPGAYEQDIKTSNLYELDSSSYRSVNIVGGEHFVVTIKPKI